jgi:hypothetical protein
MQRPVPGRHVEIATAGERFQACAVVAPLVFFANVTEKAQ